MFYGYGRIYYGKSVRILPLIFCCVIDDLITLLRLFEEGKTGLLLMKIGSKIFRYVLVFRTQARNLVVRGLNPILVIITNQQVFLRYQFFHITRRSCIRIHSLRLRVN